MPRSIRCLGYTNRGERSFQTIRPSGHERVVAGPAPTRPPAPHAARRRSEGVACRQFVECRGRCLPPTAWISEIIGLAEGLVLGLPLAAVLGALGDN
jgi:hypothetical protein